MQSVLKKTLGFVTLATLISSCGMIDGRSDGKRIATASSDVPDSAGAAVPVPEAEDDGMTAQNVITHDEVGYASWYGAELRGQPAASGEPFNPEGFTAAHPTLPVPSYVEVTHLDTGKTIVVRINDRGPSTKGRAIDLSEGAARLLGIGDKGTAPVRIRRVNPPDQEKVALRMGQKGSDRLDTPTSLLTVLRKKLGTGGPVPLAAPAVRQAAAPPSVVRKPVTMLPPVAQEQMNDDGFVIEQAGVSYPAQRTASAQRPASRPAPARRAGTTYDAPSSSGGFVTEDAGQRSSAGGDGYFIQVAAFGNEARARATAGQVGAGIVRAGTIWRVRKGPFATESAARAALGSVTAKGYRDARITR